MFVFSFVCFCEDTIWYSYSNLPQSKEFSAILDRQDCHYFHVWMSAFSVLFLKKCLNIKIVWLKPTKNWQNEILPLKTNLSLQFIEKYMLSKVHLPHAESSNHFSCKIATSQKEALCWFVAKRVFRKSQLLFTWYLDINGNGERDEGKNI